MHSFLKHQAPQIAHSILRRPYKDWSPTRRRVGSLHGAPLKVRDAMAALDPNLIQAMRDAPEEAMTRVPTEYATSETKAYLAEHILKAAARGV
jgi:hypothetical protein